MRLSRIVAAFTAAALVLFCSDRITADICPAVRAEVSSDSMQLPEWVPDSYGNTLHFFNLHGGTYIQDGLLCVIFCRGYARNADVQKAEYNVSVTEGVMEEVSHELYQYQSENGFAAYNDFEVFVYKPVSSGRFDISLSGKSMDTSGAPDDNTCLQSYEFSVDDKLDITETDLCAQLPDCTTEFEKFYEEHDIVSVIDDKLVFCLKNPSNMFSEWKEGRCSENMRQTARWSCIEKTPSKSMVFGGPVPMMDIVVYEAVSEGPVYVCWNVVDIYHPEDTIHYGIAASYQDASFKTPSLSRGDARIKITDYETGKPVILDENTGFGIHYRSPVTDSSTLISSIQSNPCVIPDLVKPAGKTSDGGFQSDAQTKNIIPISADSLGFRLVMPDGYTVPKDEFGVEIKTAYVTVTLVNGEAYDIEYRVTAEPSGDVNGDGEFDAADFVTLQKWLLGKPGTVLKNWKSADFCNDNVIDIFDLCLMRKAFIAIHQEPPVTLFVLDKSRTYNTPKGVENQRIITTLENTDLSEMEEILRLTEKISGNIDKYENMKLKRLNFSIADYGEDVLYLTYRRPDEEPDRMVICTYGENCSWLDDKDVQELVILMIENGYFATESDADTFRGFQ